MTAETTTRDTYRELLVRAVRARRPALRLEGKSVVYLEACLEVLVDEGPLS